MLRLKLQMAMFRVKTNQLTVPIDHLRVPAPLPSASLPRPPNSSLPSTPRQKRKRSASHASTTDDDLPQAPMDLSPDRDIEDERREGDLTSSAVKGHAISGLLELRHSAC
jgi:hypothetical protein